MNREIVLSNLKNRNLNKPKESSGNFGIKQEKNVEVIVWLLIPFIQ